MREIVREGGNGHIVPGGDPPQLARVLEEFIADPLQPDRKSLHDETANRYGFSAIGKQFENFYGG
jgi:glycosyltransferase involved in cell wall biosynthesis